MTEILVSAPSKAVIRVEDWGLGCAQIKKPKDSSRPRVDGKSNSCLCKEDSRWIRLYPTLFEDSAGKFDRAPVSCVVCDRRHTTAQYPFYVTSVRQTTKICRRGIELKKSALTLQLLSHLELKHLSKQWFWASAQHRLDARLVLSGRMTFKASVV